MPIEKILTFDVMSQFKTSDEIRIEFGRYMQREREAKGLKQKYVADKMGITTTQLSRIETGKSGTERDTVIVWAKTVGVDVNDALRQYRPENLLPENSYEVSRGITIFIDIEAELDEGQTNRFVDATRLIAQGIKTDSERTEKEIAEPK